MYQDRREHMMGEAKMKRWWEEVFLPIIMPTGQPSLVDKGQPNTVATGQPSLTATGQPSCTGTASRDTIAVTFWHGGSKLPINRRRGLESLILQCNLLHVYVVVLILHSAAWVPAH
jgi:hypothetical protein